MESTFTDFGVAIHQHWLIWLWKCNLINNLITEVGNDLEIREGIANLNSQQVANEMAIRKMEILTTQRSAFWRGVGESGAICKKSSENNSSRSNCHRWSPLHGSIWSNIDSKRPNTHFSQRGPSRPGTTDAKSLPAWRPHPHVPPDTEDSFHPISRRRWIQAQYLINQFWKRWVREYVPALMERQKWLTHKRDMQVGDEVLVVGNNLRRGEWLVGSVTRVYLRENGAVRFADVQTKSGNYTRPVAKLCFCLSQK